MTSTRTSRIALLAAAAGALLLTGCQSSGPSRPARGQPRVISQADIAKARELTAKADKAYREGKFEKADLLYRESLSVFSDQTGAWNNLGNVLMAQENYVDAEAAFQRAIEIEPDRPEPYTSLGRLWYELGYAEKGMNYFDEALAIDERWLPAIRGRAAVVHQLNRAPSDYLDMLRRGRLMESNPEWQAFFDRERSRVEQSLAYDG